MSLVAQGPKRDRRLYTSKGDPEILKHVAKYQFLTVEQAASLLKRNIIATRRRMMQLHAGGILNRVRVTESPYPMWVYFLAENGGGQAAELGYLPAPRWTDAKSPTHVMHDLTITDFHLALEKALHESGHTLLWEQWRGDMADMLDPDGEIDLIPDARFIIDDEEPSLLEVVRSYESEYERGKSSLQKKLEAYKKLGIHRVYITMPTKLRVANFLGKIEEEMPSTQFWFTDEESFKQRILGKIWWTPKDFRDRTYSVFK
ncbi:MAG TPA: replication-relaxation family protein [Patescibacteria group bacterium]|nr:replication-relaxation family protein [Patescibacteria group bacterium]